ncbi:MAG: bifunctional riboflavin kinase/FAD synthetase [Candidatus Zixiibacteriota bacterium]
MTFVKGLEHYRKTEGRCAAVTIGTFDGIHRGHQEIFKTLGEVGKGIDCDPVLVTFNPHPRVVVTPEEIPLLLTTIKEKEKFIPSFFKGTVLVLEFNEKLKEMSADDFVKSILIDRLGARKVIVGYDHAFGKNRSGSIDNLRALGEQYGFEVQVVEPVMYGGKPISSSRIRAALRDNDYVGAIEMLGHHYGIYGVVERGIGLGRRLGYPTANLRYSGRKLLPSDGVYSCWAEVGGECKPGMMFIGTNYFNPQQRLSVEANLFDFDRDIYEEEMMLYPSEYLRSNRRFDSTEKLKEQLKLDKQNVLSILEKERKDDNEQRAQSSNRF